jgi:hypothetical protein
MYDKEGYSHIVRCEETRRWRERGAVDKRITSIKPKIGIKKDSYKQQKTGLYLSKHKEMEKMRDSVIVLKQRM